MGSLPVGGSALGRYGGTPGGVQGVQGVLEKPPPGGMCRGEYPWGSTGGTWPWTTRYLSRWLAAQTAATITTTTTSKTTSIKTTTTTTTRVDPRLAPCRALSDAFREKGGRQLPSTTEASMKGPGCFLFPFHAILLARGVLRTIRAKELHQFE